MMSEMPPTPFDLKPVFVDGVKVEARPTAWDKPFADSYGNDNDGNPTKPITYMTTCPQCAQVIIFGPPDLFVGKDGSVDNIACGACEAGTARAPDKVALVEKMKVAQSPFVDPVAGKLLDISGIDPTIQPFKVSE